MHKEIHDFQGEFSDILKRQRLASKLTQTRLAALISVDATELSRWENGHKVPSPGQLHDIFRRLDLPREACDLLWTAWARANPERIHPSFLPELERPEAMADYLSASINHVRQLRKAGYPRNALDLSQRDAQVAVGRIQQFPATKLHGHLLTNLSELLLEECKAALDFMPRYQVRSGALEPLLRSMRTLIKQSGTAESRFLHDLAEEGVTYVGGNADLAFKQVVQLVQWGSRIPPSWRAEVLRAAAITAGKREDRETLETVEVLIHALLAEGDLSASDKAFLLEGLGRSWGGITPGKGEEIIAQAWSLRSEASGSEGASLLRAVQLTRSEAEVVAAHRGVKNDGAIVLKIEDAIRISQSAGYDRYVHQLTRWLKSVA